MRVHISGIFPQDEFGLVLKRRMLASDRTGEQEWFETQESRGRQSLIVVQSRGNWRMRGKGTLEKLGLQILSQGYELPETHQQLANSLLRTPDIEIVPKGGLPTPDEPRLSRIDFPRMKVCGRWLSFALANPAKAFEAETVFVRTTAPAANIVEVSNGKTPSNTDMIADMKTAKRCHA